MENQNTVRNTTRITNVTREVNLLDNIDLQYTTREELRLSKDTTPFAPKKIKPTKRISNITAIRF